MSECRLVLARGAADAAARIGEHRAAHLALIEPMAASGALILGIPLMGEGAGYQGSLMLVTPEALDGYLAAEPFLRHGIWASHAVHRFRIAPLPYRPLPKGPAPAQPSHAVAIAFDGTDEGALPRRLAVREAHLARVRPAAEDGTLTLGGAILNEAGGMAGSVAITAHASLAEAQRWWAADPYLTGGVWQRVEWHASRFAPLPYRALPG
ncbi:YciI family protein [Teichococcus deserti]|uniref:YciI family protein n=1 Tax=Teichococcus deserti TaxID=1817963 RepID=UPI001F616806|nr:YciI family protein [Pseudoroseomonas deserti]